MDGDCVGDVDVVGASVGGFMEDKLLDPLLSLDDINTAPIV